MALSLYVEVQYTGKDGKITASPVFDTLNLPIPVAGKIAGGNMDVIVQTFFLVYEDSKEKKLIWIQKETTNIIKVGD